MYCGKIWWALNLAKLPKMLIISTLVILTVLLLVLLTLQAKDVILPSSFNFGIIVPNYQIHSLTLTPIFASLYPAVFGFYFKGCLCLKSCLKKPVRTGRWKELSCLWWKWLCCPMHFLITMQNQILKRCFTGKGVLGTGWQSLVA